MAVDDDTLWTYYLRHRAEIDTAANLQSVFLLDYLSDRGPMAVRDLTHDLGLSENSVEPIIKTLLDHGMVDKGRIKGRISISNRGRLLLRQVLGESLPNEVDDSIRLFGSKRFLPRGPNFRRRNDLIIGMTLAEIFLLLLFVVWYGTKPRPLIVPDTAVLKDENQKLSSELARNAIEMAELRQQLEQWHRLTGFKNPPSPEALDDWRGGAGRSYGRCEENNVLVKVSVVEGSMSLRWLQTSPKLSKWLTESRLPNPSIGVRITDRHAINSLLGEIRDYYRHEKAAGTPCRFDYDMTYATKEDYFDGRELFEPYFYPHALTRVK